jgi:hypothetical protein
MKRPRACKIISGLPLVVTGDPMARVAMAAFWPPEKPKGRNGSL